MSTPIPLLSSGSLVAAALLVSWPTEALAEPVDAPAGCVEPAGGDGMAEVVARGPVKLGTYKLVDGKALDTPKLRLLARGKFIPARVGAKEGEVVASMAAALLPDVDLDGENPENSVDNSGLGSMRVGSYRVTMRVLEAKAGAKPTYEAVVDDVGCPEKAVHAPLASGAQKTFWLSTEGVASYSFSTGEWYESVPRTYVALTADLDPAVQQTAGQRPHGWINVQALDSRNGVTKSEERLLDQLDGAVMTLSEHKVEILKVVLGAETERATPPAPAGQVATNGDPPSVSVLVRLTRTADAKPSRSKASKSIRSSTRSGSKASKSSKAKPASKAAKGKARK